MRVKDHVNSLRMLSVSAKSTAEAGVAVAAMHVVPFGSVAEAATETCMLLPWKSAMVAVCVRLHVMLAPASIVLPSAGAHEPTVAGLAENAGVFKMTVPVLVRVTALVHVRTPPAGWEQRGHRSCLHQQGHCELCC
jgi:hypothetical protein